MKLYLIHCGFYDETAGFGVYEFHTNIFVSAEDANQARLKAKDHSEFKNRRMHVDGVLEINAVGGYAINLVPTNAQGDDIKVIRHRDLAPKPTI